jgi:flagellar basal body-associated protein FliL
MRKEIIIGLIAIIAIIVLITIVAIVAISIFTVSIDESASIEEESTAPVSPIKPEGTLSNYELLENPVYDT